MAFCTQCGAQLEEGAKFCTVCGARQPETESPAAPQPSYSYTPPAAPAASQGAPSYSYDPTVYAGKNKKGGKKKGGKVVVIILAVLAVIAALVYVLAGKLGGGGKSVDPGDPVLGLYTAQKAEASGMTISVKTMWKNGFTIELKDKGKAEINVDGNKGSAKWTLDGETFTIKGSGVDCSGTLADGMLTLEDVMGTGVTLYFTKDGASIPSAETEKPQASSAPAWRDDVLGLYHADKGVAYGNDIPIETMWENGFAIELKADGKCSLNINGTEGSGSWSMDGDTISFNVPGFNMDGTLVDGVLTLKDVYGLGVDLYFTQDGSLVPASKPETTSADSWWEGDWYGWWVVYDAGGFYQENEYINQAWDVCSTIEVYGDGTAYIEIWDEDGDDVAWADLSIAEGSSDKGCMTSVDGMFYNRDITKGEWSIDPAVGQTAGFDDLFCIHGYYAKPSNADDWIEYYIFLRPWGTRWEDMDDVDATSGMIYPGDMLPLEYENWYLPLIESGASMPEGFEGLER